MRPSVVGGGRLLLRTVLQIQSYHSRSYFDDRTSISNSELEGEGKL